MSRVKGQRCLSECLGALWLAVCLCSPAAMAERIKDLAAIHGERSNQLFGYGLVVGLKGTGDNLQSRFTFQSLAALLGRQGIRVDPSEIQVRNVAAVMVTADLPPFARSGSRLDVIVSSLGNARSLQGGTLVLTPLKAVDGNIYAVAQGSISVGGFDVSSGGASMSKNHTTAGRVPAGALVEREVPVDLAASGTIQLNLLSPDFTTAQRITDAINGAIGAGLATAPDPGVVKVSVPAERKDRLVALVTEIERLEVDPDNRSRVVINERTGTVVMGASVRIANVAIAHGALHLEVRPRTVVSQPAPLSRGQTVAARQDEVNVEEQPGSLQVVERSATLGDVVRALNALGVTPRDLIDILQAIRAAGALPAELDIL